MALFQEKRELTENEIASLITRIEQEENATNIRYVGSGMASYKFMGTIDGRELEFNVDNKSFFIITEEY